jgi:alginate O-acetyltransferase complex protein AlgJ
MGRRQLIRVAVAVLAAAFFVTPLVLRAAGTRVRSFENRRLEPAPKLADGWNVFDVATRYLIDRMPLRDQAVHANTWIDENVFGTTPVYGQNGLGGVQSDQALPFSGRPAQDRAALNTNTTPTTPSKPGRGTAAPPATATQVTAGTDGWFFLEGALQRACAPFTPFTAATREWERLIQVIRASGRRVELIVTPDKSTIYPEYLPPSTPDLACGKLGTAALWRLIESAGARLAGIVGLREGLLAAKHASPTLLYFKTDSHWNSLGALTMTESVLPPLSSTVRVSPSEIVNTGNVHLGGDLLGLLGQSGGEIAPTRGIRRAPGSPTIAAATLVLGDSYDDAAVPEMTPYFQHLTSLNWNGSTPQQQAKAIAAAHDVILQTVEREFDYRATGFGFASPAFVKLVQRTLAAHAHGRAGTS